MWIGAGYDLRYEAAWSITYGIWGTEYDAHNARSTASGFNASVYAYVDDRIRKALQHHSAAPNSACFSLLFLARDPCQLSITTRDPSGPSVQSPKTPRTIMQRLMKQHIAMYAEMVSAVLASVPAGLACATEHGFVDCIGGVACLVQMCGMGGSSCCGAIRFTARCARRIHHHYIIVVIAFVTRFSLFGFDMRYSGKHTNSTPHTPLPPLLPNLCPHLRLPP